LFDIANLLAYIYNSQFISATTFKGKSSMKKLVDIITELETNNLKSKDIFELIGNNLIVELDLSKEDKKNIMKIIGQINTLCEFGEQLVSNQLAMVGELWQLYPSSNE